MTTITCRYYKNKDELPESAWPERGIFVFFARKSELQITVLQCNFSVKLLKCSFLAGQILAIYHDSYYNDHIITNISIYIDTLMD